ncbi:hypothetical protein RhiJN_26616 [Ceratobasidium sp. AG-Ba]|nr:hypothetical protein RhiJN_26616 [Ceratobasidium sp. AG-Ba]
MTPREGLSCALKTSVSTQMEKICPRSSSRGTDHARYASPTSQWIRITLDANTLSVTIKVYICIPFIGCIKVASVVGSLKKGVKANFNVTVTKSFVALFLKGKKLWVGYEISSEFFPTIKGEHMIWMLQ